MTFAQMKDEYRLSCDGDAWGNAMAWWFTIADEIHFNRDCLECPASWRFRPSPLGASNDDDDYIVGVVRDVDDVALIRFGRLIDRYARALRHAGQDY